MGWQCLLVNDNEVLMNIRKSFKSILFVLILLLQLTQIPAHAHSTYNEQEKIRHTLLTWANGLLNANAEQMAPVLGDEFSTHVFTWTRLGGVLDKRQYLERVAGNSWSIIKVDLQYADHKRVGERVYVSPVILHMDPGSVNNRPLKLGLLKKNGQWQIDSISAASYMPSELVSDVLPERSVLYPVAVSVMDAQTLEPIVTRVHTHDGDEEYWPPQGHMKNIRVGWREHIGGDVRVEDRTYAYVESEFILPVPEGSYELEVVRGLEYEPQIIRFNVSESKVPELRIKLERWSNVQEQGWYSGDTHVHFIDPQTAALESAGEDLNVVNVLATKWGELITNVEHFTGEPSVFSDAKRFVYVGEELRHGFLGHTLLLNLKSLVYPITWGGPGNGVPGGFDYPPMANQTDKARAQGALVSWAHFPVPGGEVAVDVALGKIDAVDLVTWTDPFVEDVPIPAARTYYRFLNTGFRLPALGGTDKMLNSQVVGAVRTYVKVDGEFDYENWIEGIRAGRTFVSTGPMLMFTVNGKGAGETISAKKGEVVSIHADVNSFHPIERIEIIMGGKIVANKENTSGSRRLSFDTELTIEGSSWLAARVYSSKVLPSQTWDFLGAFGMPVLAHTSPVYIEVDGQPITSPTDAAILAEWCEKAIEWARTKANVQTEAQRQEMITLFEKAKAIYLKQVPSKNERKNKSS